MHGFDFRPTEATYIYYTIGGAMDLRVAGEKFLLLQIARPMSTTLYKI